MEGRKHMMFLRIAGTIGAIVLAVTSMSSCGHIYEDLEPCPHGVSLRFVYDYNMEYANSFSHKVDCLTLLVYDDEGNHIDTRTVTGPELRDESYRMTLDLEEGTYRFVAYGGIACEESSFSFRLPERRTSGTGARYENLLVAMNEECLSHPDKRRLHDLYWGELTMSTAELYSQGTLKMMKNTNNIRIVLQQVDGEPVHAGDFEFSITDDNTLFGPDNDLIPNGTVTYYPWTSGDVVAGVSGEGENEGEPVVVAYSEFSTSRLMRKNSPRLLIRLKEDGREIVDIPLNDYLLLLKSELYAKMPPQEFLDRESLWSVVFFLGHDMSWLRTHIKINDWVVRINNAEM